MPHNCQEGSTPNAAQTSASLSGGITNRGQSRSANSPDLDFAEVSLEGKLPWIAADSASTPTPRITSSMKARPPTALVGHRTVKSQNEPHNPRSSRSKNEDGDPTPTSFHRAARRNRDIGRSIRFRFLERGRIIRVHTVDPARTAPFEQAVEPVTAPSGHENQEVDRNEDVGRSADQGNASPLVESRPQTIIPDEEPFTAFVRIKVIGVGGAGGNTINRMMCSGIGSIECVAVNTDAQALINNEAPTAVRIGDKLTKGLGAKGRPEVGERAAEESAEGLDDLMYGADMIFITAGMGGGTGTGASPILAKLAKQAGALTIAFVTRPFEFEGSRRVAIADAGINALRDVVDALITIPNERLLHMVDPKTSITDAFQIADDVLRQLILGISDLITKPGVINLDFADVKMIMQDAGSALVAIGHGSGENRCLDAAREAVESPLMEMSIKGATGVLFCVTGGRELTPSEISEAAEIIRAAAHEDAEIIYGMSIDESLEDDVKILLVATGGDDRPKGITRPLIFGRERGQLLSNDRERASPAMESALLRTPRQPVPAPILPEDDWDDEPSIINFLSGRDRGQLSQAPSTPPSAPRQSALPPARLEDDWDDEPAIIQFLRDR